MQEVTAVISGYGAYSRLKHESGVHRAQRVPSSEQRGRIHTSTIRVTVACGVDSDLVLLPRDTVRTYDFSSNRVTNHRFSLTLHQLDEVLAGRLDPLLDTLSVNDAREVVDAEATLTIEALTGNEASQFVAEVLEMYARYAEGRKWRVVIRWTTP